ncbi:cyclin-dependent kinase inhibitor 7-like isoform X2 [Hibiscus syriacus]|uniref:cyclin-dependent kinase inhibitor 7-like isoform X2 n=1 Tax=Hibiscus syriacus TaxID=106335 RepID=UPI001923F9F3|nr:cyclin-dependent kinase inhibitor 7-like isoform X2 [Hibiscus syriacus]
MVGSMRNCKRSGETAEMEPSCSSFSLSKRRKAVGPRELKELELTSPDIELENPRFLSNSENQPINFATFSDSCGLQAGDMCSGLFSGDSLFSRCSSNEPCDILKDSLRIVDLEAKSSETEISTCTNIIKFRETTPLSELCGGSDEMDSPAQKPFPSPEKPPKMPSKAEIDEFFSVAEKYQQKRFAEKYNYDIVKDVPLNGRYRWLRLQP